MLVVLENKGKIIDCYKALDSLGDGDQALLKFLTIGDMSRGESLKDSSALGLWL